MKAKDENEKYIAFLRGINVGGHHKVPMAQLKTELEQLGFENITTILNSGNIIFDAKVENTDKIENTISAHLENHFKFTIPTIVRKSENIHKLFLAQPFQNVTLTKDIRLYVSFLKSETDSELLLPWKSEDESYEIISKTDKSILSILDLSVSKTPKAMEALEKYFGKDITTRNWNTIEKVEKKL